MRSIVLKFLKNKVVFNISKKFNIFTTTKNVTCNKINLPQVLKRLSISKKLKILTCEQVHGKEIEFVMTKSKKLRIKNKVYKISNIKNVDGIITNNIRNLICIFTADCVPLFLFNEQKNIFGIIHIGRKGLLKGIIESMIKKIKKYNLQKFYFIIGPHICDKCYKIDLNLVKDALRSYNEKNKSFSLSKEIVLRLTKYGVKKGNIFNTNLCTYHNKEKFFSYRRGDKEKRLVSVIYCKNFSKKVYS